MRPTPRRTAAAVALATACALPVPAAQAAGGCTPIGNRARIVHHTVVTRTSTSVITADSVDVPKDTVDGATVVSRITLADSGTVRSVKVKDIHLADTSLNDITLSLRAPDGALVLLANSLAGANLNGTTFSDAAPSIFVGLPPYLGTFAPQDWLAQLYGEPIAGDWQLEITDAAGGGTGTLTGWSLEVTPESCGEQPLAAFTATPNPVNPGGTVSFDAGSSTGGNSTSIVHYEWDFDGDGVFETDGGTASTITHVYAARGTYAAAVRVTDAQGFSDTRVQAIAVTAKPIASFTVTPSSPLSLVNTTLDAGASIDPDGTIVRYEWDLDGNGSFEVDGGNIPTIQKQFGKSGPRMVGLQVTDDSGASTVALKSVTVQNRVPLADFGSQTVPAIVGAATTLDATASVDLDGTVADYEWDLDNDGTYETHSGGSPTTIHVFPASGSYTIGLRITDNGGESTTTTKSVVATQAPVAMLGAAPLITRPQTPVTFDPAGSADQDVTGSIVRYDWDFDGDGSVDLATTSGLPVTHAYGAFAQYTAKLTVVDDLGATGSATVGIDVHNDPPVAALSISPSTAQTGVPVTLSGAGSLDADGPIAKYEWDIDGNGSYETNSGTTATVVRTFPNRMRATVRLRVTDSDGATAVSTAPLAVDPPAGGPVTPPAGGPGGAGSPGTGADGAPGAGGGTGGAFTASLGGASIQRLRKVVRRGVGVSCQVDRQATCELELVVAGRDARRLRLARGKRARKPVRIARGTAVATASGVQTLALRLTPKARRALRRSHRRLVVIVQGTATDASGAKATLRRAVMLR